MSEPERLSANAHASIANPDLSFLLLPIELRHGLRAGSYPLPHRDPFDRLLAAQAELQNFTLVSVDPALKDFPCRLLW